ncbi:MAG: alanine racemase [Blastocatellia bacterium]
MLEIESQRPTWAKIDLNNLAFNYHSIRKFVGESVKQMAIVKANAYGHGAIECAKRLDAEGVDWFGVAIPEEGVQLRMAGVRKPILCLGGFWPGQGSLLVDNEITPAIFDIDRAIALDGFARTRGKIVDVHVKIDTGMGRLGVPFRETGEFAERLRALPNLRIDGMMTHFAAADDLKSDFTAEQMRRFSDSVDIFCRHGFRPSHIDMANSPGAIAFPESRGSMVRIGGILYGLGEDVLPKGIERPELRPVMSLHSRIGFLKRVAKGESLGYGRTYVADADALIATVPIGYHDGYRRSLSNRAAVLVNGEYAPVVGRISMDWTIIDVTNIPNPAVGDEIILIGEQNGNHIAAEAIAEAVGTISYEITCGIGERVRRIYTG